MSDRNSFLVLRLAAAIVAVLVTAFTSPGARAQEAQPATGAAEENASGENQPATVESLEQRLRILERKLENAEEEAATRAKSGATVTAGERGFSIKSADGAYDLKLRLVAQADGRFVLDPDPAFNDTFLLRRLRPSFEAQLGKYVAARLTPEFAGNSATVVDAYLDLKLSPFLVIRAGKVKGPVGLERLQSAPYISFIERAYPTELAPNRDIGVTFLGDYDGGVISYAVGYYNGTADGRDAATTDIDDKKEIAARVFFEPFRNDPGLFQNLGFGIAGSSGTQLGTSVGTGGVLPQYRTPAQQTFFQYNTGVAAAGTHQRLTGQAYWYRYALGLMTEYIESSQEIAAGALAAELEHDAWQATASYVLTGEDASYRGVAKPAKPFATGEDSGWGAFEVVLRASELDVDDGAFAGFANPATQASNAFTWGAGLNWYPTGNARLSINYLLTEFEGGAAAGADRADEKAVLARLQIAY